jgi:VWFA-related protein
MRLVFLVLYSLLLTSGSIAQTHSSKISISMSPLYLGSFPNIGFYATINLQGNLATKVHREDFTLFEDDSEILDFSLTLQSEPAEVAMILDTSGSVKDFAHMIRKGAKGFFEQLAPQDRAMLVTFSNRVKIANPMTSDHSRLKESIDEMQVYGGTRLYDGVYTGLQNLKTGRRFAVVFTDGQDMKFPTDTKRFSRHSLEDVIDLAREKNIPIFGIGVGSGIDTSVMEAMCSRSGGKFFESIEPGSLPSIYSEISTWIRNRYLVAYTSPRSKSDGSWRRVLLQSNKGIARDQKRYRLASQTFNSKAIQSQASPPANEGLESLGDFVNLNLFESTGITISGDSVNVQTPGVSVKTSSANVQVAASGGLLQGSFVHISGGDQSVVVEEGGGVRIQSSGGTSRIRVDPNGTVLIASPTETLRVSSNGVLIGGGRAAARNSKVMRSVAGQSFVQHSNTIVSVSDQRVYVKVGELQKGTRIEIPQGTIAFEDGALYAPVRASMPTAGPISLEIPGMTRIFASGGTQTVEIPGSVRIHQGDGSQEVIVPGVRIHQGKDGQSINAGGVSIETGKGGVKIKIPGLGELDLGSPNSTDDEDDEEDDDDDEDWNVFD